MCCFAGNIWRNSVLTQICCCKKEGLNGPTGRISRTLRGFGAHPEKHWFRTAPCAMKDFAPTPTVQLSCKHMAASIPEQNHSSLSKDKEQSGYWILLLTLSVCYRVLCSGGFQTYLTVSHKKKKYILYTLHTCIHQKEKFYKTIFRLTTCITLWFFLFLLFYFIKKKCWP